MPTAPSVNGHGKVWLTDGGVVFAEASVSQSNRFAGFFPLLPVCCDARSQHVVVNGFKSKNMILNTGVPQGCVLSPILFSIYTNNITNNNSDIPLFNYADDMALVADIKDHSSLAAYYQQVNALQQWIKESSLELNISKTKELCCGGRQTSSPQPLFEPLRLNGQTVEQV